VRKTATTIVSRAALAALVALSAGAAAADPRPVHPYRVNTGQRVRLWTAPELGGMKATTATVTAVDSSGLTVVIKDRTALVPFIDLDRMEVRQGWRYVRRAALVGLVVGAVAGVLAEDGGDGEDKLRSGAIYGGVGAAVGGMAAAAIWPARWVPVDIDDIREPVADRGAVRLSFTLSF
jgi:hypothetical protein